MYGDVFAGASILISNILLFIAAGLDNLDKFRTVSIFNKRIEFSSPNSNQNTFLHTNHQI